MSNDEARRAFIKQQLREESKHKKHFPAQGPSADNTMPTNFGKRMMPSCHKSYESSIEADRVLGRAAVPMTGGVRRSIETDTIVRFHNDNSRVHRRAAASPVRVGTPGGSPRHKTSAELNGTRPCKAFVTKADHDVLSQSPCSESTPIFQASGANGVQPFEAARYMLPSSLRPATPGRQAPGGNCSPSRTINTGRKHNAPEGQGNIVAFDPCARTSPSRLGRNAAARPADTLLSAEQPQPRGGLKVLGGCPSFEPPPMSDRRSPLHTRRGELRPLDCGVFNEAMSLPGTVHRQATPTRASKGCLAAQQPRYNPITGQEY
jgi:hypothetical protein